MNIKEIRRREAIAVEKADLEIVYSVDTCGNWVDVKGETGGDLRHIRVVFKNDGTVDYIGEK